MPQRPSRSERTSKKTRLTSATGKAPGKIILSGEQFVVLGAPAVAMAINFYSSAKVKPNNNGGVDIGIDIPLRFLARTSKASRIDDPDSFLRPLKIAAEATLERISHEQQGLDVNVTCEIPIAAGLGSSASTTVAIISGVCKSQNIKLGRAEMFKLAFIPERYLHGNPSGVDQATCIYGGTIEFARPSRITPVQVKADPILLLCDSGIHHETKALVSSVVKKSLVEKDRFKDHLNQVRDISKGVVKSLKRGDSADLGDLMSQNHELLKKIGVSHPKLDRLVSSAKQAGALGAKLTGAGGGGCIVAVCSDTKVRKQVAKSLVKQGGIPYLISRDMHGVQ